MWGIGYKNVWEGVKLIPAGQLAQPALGVQGRYTYVKHFGLFYQGAVEALVTWTEYQPGEMVWGSQ